MKYALHYVAAPKLAPAATLPSTYISTLQAQYGHI